MEDLTLVEVLRRAREFHADAEYIKERVTGGRALIGRVDNEAYWHNLRLECQRSETRCLDEIACRFTQVAR